MTNRCAYCGCDVFAHEPVFVEEERVDAGQFCNYACLLAFVNEEELTIGATGELGT